MKNIGMVVMEEVISKYPELERIIEKEYGVVAVHKCKTIQRSLSGIKVDVDNSWIVVCGDDILVDVFDIYKFVKYLGMKGMNGISSLILVRPKIDEEVGFESEVVSLKEISFGEVTLPRHEGIKIIFSTREIPVIHDDFYQKHNSNK